MKLVYIIGCGMNMGSLTSEGAAALSEAQVIMGSPRLLECFANPSHECFSAYRKSEVDSIVASSDKNVFALLVSGDTGFYSAASFYGENCDYRVRFIAGISSVNYFFAKYRLPWQDAKLLSAHGTSCAAIDAVRRNRLTFLLTGGNVNEIATGLCDSGFGSLKVHVGEALGDSDEKVNIMSVCDLRLHSFSPLTVLIIENPTFDKRLRIGIPDSEFTRSEGIPMSRSTTRAAIISALEISPDHLCWDVGCGTGSVTVEMALAAYEGKVFSIDKSPRACELTQSNCSSFHIGNVSTINGLAPEALRDLPAPSRVFIGGSCGKVDEIVRLAISKNSTARIVITATSPQSATAAIEALQASGMEAQLMQQICATGKKTAGLHMLQGGNPVYIVLGDGLNG